jgi:hypothetical protein
MVLPATVLNNSNCSEYKAKPTSESPSICFIYILVTGFLCEKAHAWFGDSVPNRGDVVPSVSFNFIETILFYNTQH